MGSNLMILLVEDDQIDVLTVRRAMRDAGLSNPLHVVGDGVDALDWLRAPDHPKPGLILLDLNTPRMNGIEFLQTVCGDEAFHDLNIVVLTTSEQERELVAGLCVAGYLIKPANYVQFVQLVQSIHVKWLGAINS